MSAILPTAQDFMYLKMKTHNVHPSAEIPAEVSLDEREDILDSQSGWLVAIDSFQASLGASSLKFSISDDESGLSRNITYEQLNKRVADDPMAADETVTVARETRNLQKDTFSIGGMFTELNPVFGGVKCGFRALSDGAVALEHDDSRDEPTAITMSQDLLDYLQMNGAQIERRRQDRHKESKLRTVLDWVGAEDSLFMRFRPLTSYLTGENLKVLTLRSGVNFGTNHPVGYVPANPATGDFIHVMVSIPSDYFTDNGLKLPTDTYSPSFNDIRGVPTFLDVKQFVRQQVFHGTAASPLTNQAQTCMNATAWTFSLYLGQPVLELQGFTNKPIAIGERLLIADPFLRTFAGICQMVCTPTVTSSAAERNRNVRAAPPAAAIQSLWAVDKLPLLRHRATVVRNFPNFVNAIAAQSEEGFLTNPMYRLSRVTDSVTPAAGASAFEQEWPRMTHPHA